MDSDQPGVRIAAMRIAIALFDDVEELDWAGPWEVLAFWGQQWPEDGVEVLTVADTLQPIRCAKGLRVLADTTWERLGEVNVVDPSIRGVRHIARERLHGRARLRRCRDPRWLTRDDSLAVARAAG